tara:strand:- start:309 stop:1457 length:1149 start_codon:yes stop_codon:yes gene_type:complete
MIKEILVEQVNVSDDEYQLVEVCVKTGVKVKKGEHLLSYESSKSVFEYESSESGFFYANPKLKVEEFYDVGFKLGVISKKELKNEELNNFFMEERPQEENNNININLTKKARKLIEKNQIDVAVFKGANIVTEKHIQDYLNSETNSLLNIEYFEKLKINSKDKGGKKKKLAVIGAGKASLQLIDAILSNEEYKVVVFYEMDNSYKLKKLLGTEVKKINNIQEIKNDFESKFFDEIIISFSGDIESRSSVFKELDKINLPVANIIHNSAVISESAELGKGNIVFANTRIGPFSKIGDNNVISAGCSIEHNNILGDCNTFGPYVAFSGSCVVGNNNKFGTMIGIEPKITIGSNSIIASGVILTRNVKDNQLVRNINKIEITDKK